MKEADQQEGKEERGKDKWGNETEKRKTGIKNNNMGGKIGDQIEKKGKE